MYPTFRNIHLFLGLFACLYVLVYGVSSVKMSHRSWFASERQPIESEVSIPPEAGATARTVARELMDHQGMRGELQGGRVTASGFQFRIARLGTEYEVDYRRDTGAARVKTHTADFMSLMAGIHHQGGLWHESVLGNAFGAFVAIVSVALILLAATGIYMWFKLHNERRVGTVLLVVSLGYSLTVMILLGTA